MSLLAGGLVAAPACREKLAAPPPDFSAGVLADLGTKCAAPMVVSEVRRLRIRPPDRLKFERLFEFRGSFRGVRGGTNRVCIARGYDTFKKELEAASTEVAWSINRLLGTAPSGRFWVCWSYAQDSETGKPVENYGEIRYWVETL